MQPSADENHNLSGLAVWGIATLYLLTAALLFFFLAALWPTDPDTPDRAAGTTFHWVLTFTPEARLIWLVIITSSLGSYIHTVTSFTLYAGNRSLRYNWLAWYVLRPAISAALALIFYFALRAGLFSGSTAGQNINPFGIAAISGMVGMFSKQATEKLSKIFDTIFT